jgi:glutamyl-tRNA reductase
MILCLSASHKKANVPMLEALSFKDKDKAISSLAKLDNVQEVVFLRTCNRTEIYVVGSGKPENLVDGLLQYWSRASNISTDIIMKTIEVFLDREALLHLLRLTSGLESMVIGENEILGQVRKAYVDSKKTRTIGPILERAFTKALNVGKRVRAETRINNGLTSMSSVAVQLVEQHIPNRNEVTALLLGAGETGTLVAGELNKKGNYRILIANRTYSKGKKLADRIGGQAIDFNELPTYLSLANVVITAVYSRKPLLKVKHFKGIKKKGKTLIIDLSQPRCVDTRVSKLPNVELKNIDDIREVVNGTMRIREKERQRAESIIEEELNHLQALLAETIVQPVIAKLCANVEEIRKKEFAYAKEKLRNISETELQIIEDLTKILTTRFLQPAIAKLKLASMEPNGSLIVTAKELFGLEPQQDISKGKNGKVKNNE